MCLRNFIRPCVHKTLFHISSIYVSVNTWYTTEPRITQTSPLPLQTISNNVITCNCRTAVPPTHGTCSCQCTTRGRSSPSRVRPLSTSSRWTLRGSLAPSCRLWRHRNTRAPRARGPCCRRPQCSGRSRDPTRSYWRTSMSSHSPKAIQS